MARVVRLGGAMVLQCDGDEGSEYFLVGDTKEPCNFPAHGFERPSSLDSQPLPFVRLTVIGPVQLSGLALTLPAEGQQAAAELAERLLIARNVSVSERLWRLVTNPEQLQPEPVEGTVDGSWLMAVPLPVWNIVRDTVLRCV